MHTNSHPLLDVLPQCHASEHHLLYKKFVPGALRHVYAGPPSLQAMRKRSSFRNCHLVPVTVHLARPHPGCPPALLRVHGGEPTPAVSHHRPLTLLMVMQLLSAVSPARGPCSREKWPLGGIASNPVQSGSITTHEPSAICGNERPVWRCHLTSGKIC